MSLLSIYDRQHDYDRAKSELEQEIGNNPSYAQAYLYRGDIALHTNHSATAEPLLKKSIQLQSHRLAYFDLGSIYADQGRNQEAVTALQRAVALDPTLPDAHYRLARVYSALGRNEKAAREFANTKELHAKEHDSLAPKISGTVQQ